MTTLEARIFRHLFNNAPFLSGQQDFWHLTLLPLTGVCPEGVLWTIFHTDSLVLTWRVGRQSALEEAEILFKIQMQLQP